MRTLILFSTLAILFSFQSSAQNQDSLSIRKYYEKNAILYLGGSKYFKDSQGYKIGNLKNEIKFSPDAIEEVRKSDRDRKIYLLFSVAGNALLLSAILSKNPDNRLIYIYGSLVAAAIAIPFRIMFKQHLGKAIWFHNRDILLK